MSDEEDEDCFADMGFMFEGAEPSVIEQFAWKKPNDKTVKVSVNVVDDDPGAVQSGHYLWPGAPALAQHLLTLRDDAPRSIVELGSGCALASLTALQVFSDSLQCVVCTDHDPGTLERAKENHELNLQKLRDGVSDEDNEEQTNLLEQVSSISFLLEPLSWGDATAAEALLKKLQSTLMKRTGETEGDGDKTFSGFDMILGSDLIYCQEVVKPLLMTASHLLCKQYPECRFILSQSFVYDDGTEKEIDDTCNKLGFERKILFDTLDESNKEGVKVQEFHWR